ncbi:MAG TPA: NAD(P)-dependent oxidoreductase [Candidatus Ruania gallistercoris]|uniref:NAD(P)-dependent oxidoreductase n=1 Tax=Candidatus Ruania gallistercoris TaxID=2838746 RepID=A0A9D2J3I7_9MICO|nr:NAD(P)-dependent oxidoreductase [Candidatus Ruania gallistercoris]
MNVVVIGGAGLVGSLIVRRLAGSHQVRLADLDPADGHGVAEPMTVDVTDIGQVRSAVQGQDALVYLAMGQRSSWGETGGWVESHFDVNVKGLYLTLSAAAEAGVRQCVYASSLSIFEDYLAWGHQLEHRTPDATDGYGLTKRLGEQVCEAVSRESALPVVSLRLCHPMPDEEWRDYSGPAPETVTAASDVARAFDRALDYGASGHETFIITGDHAEATISARRTREVLGWAPQLRREEAAEGDSEG